jgi:hypothetical protein|tara:strand:+ start:66 stop:350 length:285 start_codon:yes stop_codon:yes gene_type:complete
MELSDGQKYAIVFLGSLAAAGIVLSTLVFPFWNFIREDIIEEVEIFRSANGHCYVDTADGIPKTIKNCNLQQGSVVTITYGHGLPWAKIVISDE